VSWPSGVGSGRRHPSHVAHSLSEPSLTAKLACSLACLLACLPACLLPACLLVCSPSSPSLQASPGHSLPAPLALFAPSLLRTSILRPLRRKDQERRERTRKKKKKEEERRKKRLFFSIALSSFRFPLRLLAFFLILLHFTDSFFPSSRLARGRSK